MISPYIAVRDLSCSLKLLLALNYSDACVCVCHIRDYIGQRFICRYLPSNFADIGQAFDELFIRRLEETKGVAFSNHFLG